METSIELLKLSLAIATHKDHSIGLARRVGLPNSPDLLTLVLAIDQELRSELAKRETPSSPNTAT